MKKIAIVSHGLSNGGAERVAALLANKIAEKGNKVLFIAAYSSEKEYILNSKVNYCYIKPKCKNRIIKLIHRSRDIDLILERFKAEVLISFIVNETLITNIKNKIPIIYSLRNDPNYIISGLLNKAMCFCLYRRAYKIVFQTSKAKEFFDPKVQSKGIVIGNPLTSNLPFWNKENHDSVVITACRLIPQKNLKMLIKAFSEFSKTYPEYKLSIYGKGELKSELMDYSKLLGAENNINFAGHSSEIHSIMAKSAIFVLTSNFEGLSNSMLEALAIGIPTICTDCSPGGAAEYINDFENGMLIKVGDVDGLIQRLELLAKDKELCYKLSREAVKIRRRLDENIIVEQWLDLLK